MKTCKGLVAALFVVATLFSVTSAFAVSGHYYDCETDTFIQTR